MIAAPYLPVRIGDPSPGGQPPRTSLRSSAAAPNGPGAEVTAVAGARLVSGSAFQTAGLAERLGRSLRFGGGRRRRGSFYAGLSPHSGRWLRAAAGWALRPCLGPALGMNPGVALGAFDVEGRTPALYVTERAAGQAGPGPGPQRRQRGGRDRPRRGQLKPALRLQALLDGVRPRRGRCRRCRGPVSGDQPPNQSADSEGEQ